MVGYSMDEEKTVVVGWVAEYIVVDWTQEIEYEPVAFLYLPRKIKCWGKGKQCLI
ncbi:MULTISPECIES: hypothetical protein [Bacillus]|uniref:hypothetical protein n=1 Tax=Bacillus TaxID=1386 RepID=UPI001596B1E4|nr:MULTISPECIES: hypothetical protein [Bacillus cereus group]MEC3175717.1 hypothetical protein [Bacillus cereus]